MSDDAVECGWLALQFEDGELLELTHTDSGPDYWAGVDPQGRRYELRPGADGAQHADMTGPFDPEERQ